MGNLKEGKRIEPLAFIDDPNIRKAIEEGKINISSYTGVGGKLGREMNPSYNKAESEKVIKGPTNSMIIFGKDRNGGVGSGYGGRGYTGCAAIDIVAGLGGPSFIPQTKYGSLALIEKDFNKDASRIYVSQMTNIDEYFNLPSVFLFQQGVPFQLEDSTATAGIGIKSDNVRIIARENVKIVTIHGGFNSLGRKVPNNGIDIIAGVNVVGADTDPFLKLQPMVKGDNLIECLETMMTRINNVQSELSSFIETQRKINDIMQSHTHLSGRAGKQTSSILGPHGKIHNFKILLDTVVDILSNTRSLINHGSIYFNASSPKYILSRFNKVN